MYVHIRMHNVCIYSMLYAVWYGERLYTTRVRVLSLVRLVYGGSKQTSMRCAQIYKHPLAPAPSHEHVGIGRLELTHTYPLPHSPGTPARIFVNEGCPNSLQSAVATEC